MLALPGFLASDLSMAPMRRYLKDLGYDTHAWNLGRNLGGVASKRSALRDLLKQIHDTTGRKVSIIGWSLGGVYARDLALQLPDMVRAVITLGSPFANDITATNATKLYEALSGEGINDNPEIREAIAGDLGHVVAAAFAWNPHVEEDQIHDLLVDPALVDRPRRIGVKLILFGVVRTQEVRV